MPMGAMQATWIWPKRDFETVVRKELPVLYRVARRMATCQDDAEDLVQKSLILAFNNWDRFDGRHLRAWLLKILHRENLARLRSQNAAYSWEDSPYEPADSEDLWSHVANRDQAHRILEALDGL